MYPSGELSLLAARKAVVRRRIAQRRWQCVQDAAALARPLGWISRVVEVWQRISPLVKIAGVPVILTLTRKFFGRAGRVASLARLVPLVLQTAKMVSRWRA